MPALENPFGKNRLAPSPLRKGNFPGRWPYGSSWGPALSEAEGFQGFLTQQLPLLVEKTLISFFQSSP